MRDQIASGGMGVVFRVLIGRGDRKGLAAVAHRLTQPIACTSHRVSAGFSERDGR